MFVLIDSVEYVYKGVWDDPDWDQDPHVDYEQAHEWDGGCGEGACEGGEQE